MVVCGLPAWRLEVLSVGLLWIWVCMVRAVPASGWTFGLSSAVLGLLRLGLVLRLVMPAVPSNALDCHLDFLPLGFFGRAASCRCGLVKLGGLAQHGL